MQTLLNGNVIKILLEREGYSNEAFNRTETLFKSIMKQLVSVWL